MNSKIITKLIAFMLLINATLFAQMNYYAMPPQKITVSTGFVPGALYSGAPSSDAYQVSNGAYSATGQLLFFIKNDKVFNAAGTNVGELGGYYSGQSLCSTYYTQILGEVAIVPIPGSCTDYYAIYTKVSPGASIGGCFYTKISCVSGVVTVTNQSGLLTTTCDGGGGLISMYEGFRIGAGGTIAVSKIVSGSGTTAKRYLYVASVANGVTKYEITNTNIANPTSFGTIAGINLSDYAGYELELSPDQGWLAFSNHTYATAGTKVFVIELNSLGNWPGSTAKIVTLNAIKGLEFDKTTPNANLYVAGGVTGSNVLAKINVNTLTSTLIPAGANDFSNTFLELAKNGYMIAITPGTGSVKRLSKIHPTTNAISSQNLTSNSSHTYLQMGNVYTLPDQIDGEDYTGFTGNQYVALTGITINNLNLNGDCDQGFPYPDIYNCNAMNLNATYYNNISAGSQYKIDITASSCGAAITGAGLLNYTGSWTAGAVPANYDIRNLTDVNGYKLLTATGQHLVTVSVKDACGNITTRVNSFNVLSAVPAVINLEIYNTYYTSPANTYVPASIIIASPVLTGALTAGFRINSSTGAVTGYNITIDEVSSTGVFIKNIYNKTTATTNINTVPPLSLNSLCVPATVWASTTPGGGSCTSTSPTYSGYTGYWGYQNGLISLNKYYNICVTLYNPCSNVTACSYILVNNGYAKTINPNTGLSNRAPKTDVLVYPNPANSLVNFNLTNEVEDVYTIELFDVVGKKMATITHNTALNKGENTIEFNTNALSNGTYTYKVSSTTMNKTGVLNIIK